MDDPTEWEQEEARQRNAERLKREVEAKVEAAKRQHQARQEALAKKHAAEKAEQERKQRMEAKAKERNVQQAPIADPAPSSGLIGSSKKKKGSSSPTASNLDEVIQYGSQVIEEGQLMLGQTATDFSFAAFSGKKRSQDEASAPSETSNRKAFLLDPKRLWEVVELVGDPKFKEWLLGIEPEKQFDAATEFLAYQFNRLTADQQAHVVQMDLAQQIAAMKHYVHHNEEGKKLEQALEDNNKKNSSFDSDEMNDDDMEDKKNRSFDSDEMNDNVN